MTGDRTQRTFVGQRGQRGSAHGIGRLVLAGFGDLGKPTGVGQTADGACGACGIGGVQRQGHELIGGLVLHGLIAVGRAPAEHVRIGDPGDGSATHLRVRVGLGESGKFNVIVEFTDRLETNGGVSVFPTGLRLEFVENSHVCKRGPLFYLLRKPCAVLGGRQGSAKIHGLCRLSASSYGAGHHDVT